MVSYILPIIFIIALGAIIKRLPNTTGTLFPSLEWFTFYVAFPALLFLRTAQLDLPGNVVQTLALATLLPMVVILALTLLILLLSSHKLAGPTRSSIVQGCTRPSTYFGLSVATLLFPEDISTLVMLALAIALPAANVIAVIALSWWGNAQFSLRGIIRNILLNPIILGTLVGAIVNILGIGVNPIIVETLEILAPVAMGLGLICVGGGLNFQLEGSNPIALLLTTATKLFLLPALTLLFCQWLELGTNLVLAMCFYAALPTAPNAYIMARLMGGDARLMASLITLQTLLAMVTLPLWMHWFGYQPLGNL